MTVYASSGAFRSLAIDDVIDDALRLGVTHVELSSGLAHAPALETAIARGMTAGLNFLVHNYFPAPAEPHSRSASRSTAIQSGPRGAG